MQAGPAEGSPWGEGGPRERPCVGLEKGHRDPVNCQGNKLMKRGHGTALLTSYKTGNGRATMFPA